MSNKEKKEKELRELSSLYDEYVDEAFQRLAAGASEEEGKTVTDEDYLKSRSGVEYPCHNTPPPSLPFSSFVPPASHTSVKISFPPSPLGNKTNPNAKQHAGTNPQTQGQGTNP